MRATSATSAAEASLTRNSASDMSESSVAQARGGAFPLGENCGQIGRPPVHGGDLAANLAGAAAGQPCQDLAATGVAGRIGHAGVSMGGGDPGPVEAHGRRRRALLGAICQERGDGRRIRRQLPVSAVDGPCCPPLPRAAVRAPGVRGARVAQRAVDPLLVVRSELYPGAGEGRYLSCAVP